MMQFSSHAMKRMQERAITELEVYHVMRYPQEHNLTCAKGFAGNRVIKIRFVEKESHKTIITIM
jgi:hypothetical protein